MHDCVEENGQFASFSSPGARDEERRTIRIGKDPGNKAGQFAGLRKARLTLKEYMRLGTQKSVCCPY